MNKGTARMREVVWKMEIRAAGNGGVTKEGTEVVQECGVGDRKGRN